MKRRLRPGLILGAVCLSFVLPFIFVYTVFYEKMPEAALRLLRDNRLILVLGDWAVRGENSLRDRLARQGRKASVDNRLIYVAVDRASIKLDHLSAEEIAHSSTLTMMQKGWPWSRFVFGDIINKLFKAGARVVVVDLLFPTEREGDDYFAYALDRYRNQIVMGCNFTPTAQGGGVAMSLDAPTEKLIPPTAPLDDRLAFVNFQPDEDAVVRQALYKTKYPQALKGELPSVAAAALVKFGASDKVPSSLEYFPMRFAGPPGQYKPIPVWQLFQDSFWSANLKNGEIFKDKIVILGPDGNWSHDEHPTPMGIMPGAELHLTAMAAALNGDFFHEIPLSANFLIMIGAALLAWALSRIGHPFAHLAVVIGTIFAYLMTVQFLFDKANTYILTFPPLIIFTSGSLFCVVYEFVLERVEKGRVRSTLEKYVSKNVVQEILDNSKDYESSLGGARKKVTILFSDIRDFTTMSESADSHALVNQLNEYLTEMVECVFQNQGTLDKFIGDAVMAVWGNVVSQGVEADALRAVQTALAMRRALAQLNQRWGDEGRPPLHIGMGLNHGEVIIGNMGSPRRMEFTAIGDAVNLASRLEALTKQYHVDLLIGESVAALVKEKFHLRTVALVRVKGKTRPVEVFTVLEEKETSLAVEQQELLQCYENGIRLYRKRAFKEAVAEFFECVALTPSDYLSGMYLEESQRLLLHPPDESWSGVNIMTTK
ncbi:MAG: adenylate/guanylate cyclase domain-containing protein [bacterium]